MKIDGRQLAEIVGVLAVVLSLLFVGYELRLARSVAETETLAAAIEISRAQREYITSNADIWGRGCMGEELTSSETIVFTNIAVDFVAYQFYRWGRAGVGIAYGAAAIGAPRSVARNIYDFPGFSAFWEDGRAPGSPAFKEDVTKQYKLLVESGEPKRPNVAWCGR